MPSTRPNDANERDRAQHERQQRETGSPYPPENENAVDKEEPRQALGDDPGDEPICPVCGGPGVERNGQTVCAKCGQVLTT